MTIWVDQERAGILDTRPPPSLEYLMKRAVFMMTLFQTWTMIRALLQTLMVTMDLLPLILEFSFFFVVVVYYLLVTGLRLKQLRHCLPSHFGGYFV